jgi:hypothetical protein
MKRFALLAVLSATAYADPCATSDLQMLVIEDVGTVMGCLPGANPVNGKCDNSQSPACIQQKDDAAKELLAAQELAEKEKAEREQAAAQAALDEIIQTKSSRKGKKKRDTPEEISAKRSERRARGPYVDPKAANEQQEKDRLKRVADFEGQLKEKAAAAEAQLKEKAAAAECPTEKQKGVKLWAAVYQKIQELIKQRGEYAPTEDQVQALKATVCDMGCEARGKFVEHKGAPPSSTNKYLQNIFGGKACERNPPSEGLHFCLSKDGKLRSNAASELC